MATRRTENIGTTMTTTTAQATLCNVLSENQAPVVGYPHHHHPHHYHHHRDKNYLANHHNNNNNTTTKMTLCNNNIEPNVVIKKRALGDITNSITNNQPMVGHREGIHTTTYNNNNKNNTNSKKHLVGACDHGGGGGGGGVKRIVTRQQVKKNVIHHENKNGNRMIRGKRSKTTTFSVAKNIVEQNVHIPFETTRAKKPRNFIHGKPPSDHSLESSSRDQENENDPIVDICQDDDDDGDDNDERNEEENEEDVVENDDHRGNHKEWTGFMRNIKKNDFLIQDIDQMDVNNHLACSEYCNEIFQSYRKRERLFMGDPKYMERQTDITSKMRAILIDWLVAVHQKFRLLPETLYLTINVIDRFLSLRNVKRHKLQLIGVTAMLIASKYEECTDIPRASDFVFITDEAYTREEILTMEALILKVIAFDVTVPSPLAFLGRFLKAASPPPPSSSLSPSPDSCLSFNMEENQYFDKARANSLANYALELSLQNYEMIEYTASEKAAAAVLLAGKLSGIWNWTMTLQYYSGYTEKEVKDCAQKLYFLLLAEQNEKNKLTAIKKKFSLNRYCCVSTLCLTTFNEHNNMSQSFISDSMSIS